MNIRRAISAVLLIGLIILVSSYAHDIHRKDYAFTLPPGNHISLRVTFHSSQENNLVLWRAAGPTAIAQWNNYVDNAGKLVPSPYRSVSWGPWKDDNADVPMGAFFTSAHKNGPPGGGDWYNSDDAHVITSVPATNTKPAYVVMQWSDGSSPDAVMVEMSYSDKSSAASELFNRPAFVPGKR